MNAEDIIRRNKLKRKNYTNSTTSKDNISPKLKYFKGLISRILLAIIFILSSVIFTNFSEKNKELYKSYVLENSLSFTKINNLYQEIFGDLDILNIPKMSDKTVFNNINYSNLESYKNSFKLSVKRGDAVNVITSGIVVFIGEKDDLGNTVIIQGNDGIDIWYSNLTDVDITIYDYVEAGSILGTSNSDFIYLTINKDGKYISYEEYQKLI
ncbi:MAG: M23 family metallopeptidase [Ruminococcus sp.]|nr:M23 family metallopeptidase [Ruminococcus sp.]